MLDLAGAVWRKSTRSNPQDNCVEIAELPGRRTVVDFSEAEWRKSARSNPSEACVEIAELPSMVAVRDSKNPDGPVLAFGRDAWRDFVEEIKSGRLDG